MAISFQKTDVKASSFGLPPKGPYFAKIVTAEYKLPKEQGKNPYINVSFEIYDNLKQKKGMIFDMLSTSNHALCQHRMGRFMTALGLDGKEFGSYADICKVIVERKLGFFITLDTSDYVKNNPDKARMIVDSRDDGIYYSVAEIANYMPETNTKEKTEPTEVSNDSAPFDTDDDF